MANAWSLFGLHVALETAASGVALLAAMLVVGRFRRDRERGQWLLGMALLTSAGTNVVFILLPALTHRVVFGDEVVWASMVGHFLSVAAFVGAAWTPPRRLGSRVGAARWLLGSAATALLLSAVGGAVASALLGAPIAGSVQGQGHPVLVTVQVALGAGFATAAVGFVRGRHDDLLLWVAAGTALAAISRLLYAQNPSLYESTVAAGDLLRLGFYFLLLLGAVREIAAYWDALADAAVSEERKRIARDLHDGVAQELAYILRRTRKTADDRTDDTLRALNAAALRGLDESRRAIHALMSPGDETLDRALTETLQALGEQLGVDIETDLAADVVVAPEVRETILRIVREAVHNAGQHGQAGTIVVHLHADGELRVTVEDDGRGFEPMATTPGRFGLQTMRERAQSIQGAFHLRSRPGAGTRVEVVVPARAVEPRQHQ